MRMQTLSFSMTLCRLVRIPLFSSVHALYEYYIVDAHVGKALFANAIVGALRNRGKTAILVTHALHFLSQCDYVYTIDHGRIVEAGTYAELITADGEFARLDRQFGGAAAQEEEEEKEEEAVENNAAKFHERDELAVAKEKSNMRAGAGTGKLEGRLIVSEKRTTGSVSWGGECIRFASLIRLLISFISVYYDYLKAGKGLVTAPLLVLAMILMQSSLVLNTYTLVWWQQKYAKKSFIVQMSYTPSVLLKDIYRSIKPYMDVLVLHRPCLPSLC
jgi:ATP-binding cassette, subfamily C (CFTR/MRP), member 1